MKGYKAFDSNLTCRDFQYEIGKTYEYEGEIRPCESGFHFCKDIANCYNYYTMDETTRICEVEAIGNIKTDDNVKYCTDKIIILSEIENPRLKSNLSDTNSGYCNSGEYNSGSWNMGDYNSGQGNSGNYNSGDRNSGNWNFGSCNSGDKNTGHRNFGSRNSGDENSGYKNSGDKNSGGCNSGDKNSGDWNSGNYNSGHENSGNRNSGNANSGDWNSGNRNSGVFNTDHDPKIKIFDKESDWTIDDWNQSKAKKVMDKCPYSHSLFVYTSDMTVEEIEKHSEYKTIGGYVRTVTITDNDRQIWWDNLPEEEKEAVKELPNFDADKFKKCTGITI